MPSPIEIVRVKQKPKTVKVQSGDLKYVSVPLGISADELADALSAFADEHPNHQMTKTYRDRDNNALVLTFSN